MPAHSLPLDVSDKPAKRPESIPEGIWLFPDRLAVIANARELSPRDIATLADVNESTVSRWLRGIGVGGVAVATIQRLETGLGLAPGTLTAPPSQGAITPELGAVVEAAERLGLHRSVADELTGVSAGWAMEEFSWELRRAIIGAVHVTGHALETVMQTARVVRAKVVDESDMTTGEWFALIQRRLPERPASGTFPSSSNIKLG